MAVPIETQIAIETAGLERAMEAAEGAALNLRGLGVFGAHVPLFTLQKRQAGRTRYWGYETRGERFVSLGFPEDRKADALVAFERFFKGWRIENGLAPPTPAAKKARVDVAEAPLSLAATYIITKHSSPEGPAKKARDVHRRRVILVRLAELFFDGARLEELTQGAMDRFVAWLAGETVQEVREKKVPLISSARARDDVRGACRRPMRAKIEALEFRKWLIAFARSEGSFWEPQFKFKIIRKTEQKPIPTRTAVCRVLQVARYGCRYDRESRDWERAPGFDTETGRPVMRRVCDDDLADEARPYLRPMRLAAVTGLRGVDVFAMQYQPSPECGHLTVEYLGAKKRVARKDGGIDQVDDDRFSNVVVRIYAKGAKAPPSNKRGLRSRLLHGPAQMVLRWARQDEALIEAFRSAPEDLFLCRNLENKPLEEMPNYLWNKIVARAGLDERFTFHRFKAFFVTNLFHRGGYQKKEICARTSTTAQTLDRSYIAADEDPEYLGPKNEFAARTPPTSPYLAGNIAAGVTLRCNADGRRIAPRAASPLAA